MRYRSLTIGTEPGSHVQLRKISQCPYISNKHATIFYDDVGFVSLFRNLVLPLRCCRISTGNENVRIAQLFGIRYRSEWSMVYLRFYRTSITATSIRSN